MMAESAGAIIFLKLGKRLPRIMPTTIGRMAPTSDQQSELAGSAKDNHRDRRADNQRGDGDGATLGLVAHGACTLLSRKRKSCRAFEQVGE